MLITIVTITYDNLEGLRKTAASVNTQTGVCVSDYEWLVIDGGSDDGSVQWLESSKARWLSEPDNGIFDAMNKGIDKAKGDYILFLNAGDTFAKRDSLSQLLRIINANPASDFIYADALEERAGTASAYKAARSHKNIARGMFTHHQAMVYRRAAIDTLRYDTVYSVAADYKFTVQFLQRAKKVVYEDFPLCLFETGGISQKRAICGWWEQLCIRHTCRVSKFHNNISVAIKQFSALILRGTLPALYWRIRTR